MNIKCEENDKMKASTKINWENWRKLCNLTKSKQNTVEKKINKLCKIKFKRRNVYIHTQINDQQYC